MPTMSMGGHTAHEVFGHVVGQDPSDSNFNCLHIDIFPVLLYSFKVYSTESSKMIGNSPKVLYFNWLFLKLNLFIWHYLPVLPEPRVGA